MVNQELLKRYKEYLLIIKNLSKGTYGAYSRHLEEFVEFIEKNGGPGGEEDLLKIKRGDVEAWLKHLFYEKRNSDSVRGGKLTSLKCFYDFLVYDGLLPANSIKRIPGPRGKKKKPRKFTTDQLKKIFSGPDPGSDLGVRDLAILSVFYGAGLRVSEVSGLKMKDLQFNTENKIRLFVFGKGAKERLVPLDREPSDKLKNWLVLRDKYVRSNKHEEIVFLTMSNNLQGTKLSSVGLSNILKKYADMVKMKGSDVFLHKLRATFATDLYDQCKDIMLVSALMGHESIETTKQYIAISETAIEKTKINNKRWKDIYAN
ncbi:MAG: tyrosine-type recombinase/integrase [Candidatus Peribacteraceae bacterium]|nr:tyrosine-type recombinase/integrase [Candidatus Peribacteraceae bacterium]